MNYVALFQNPFFYVPAITFLVGQVLKLLVAVSKGDRGWRYLVASGGMPSVHTATTVSLAITAVLRLGTADPLSGVLLIYTGIVVYDALGVRRSTGELTSVMNRLISDLGSKKELSGKYQRIREVLGHRPEETIVGAGLGILMAWVLNRHPRLIGLFTVSQLFTEPNFFSSNILRLFVIIFGGLLIWAICLRIWFVSKDLHAPKKKLLNRIFLICLLTGVYGLVYGFVAFQQATILSWPIWFILGMAVFIAWGIAISSYYFRHYHREMLEQLETSRRQKWLT